jgi:transposase
VGRERSLAPEMVRLSIASLLFDPSLVRVRHVKLDGQAVTVLVESVGATACCPQCGHGSPRIHSRYVRKLADVPWHGRAMQLHLKVRRFFCVVADCPRRIFAERLPTVTTSYARTTIRLREAHCTIAFALGGEAGARLAVRLAMPTSADTLLRRIRSAPLADWPVPRVLGIDDWAFRKGTRYGTILCDLERRRVVDLLPDRQADTLAVWLKQHPGIEVISRDRAGPYALGARQGAPNAVQVADRWHLLCNVREAVERLLDRQRLGLQQAATAVAEAATPTGELATESPATVIQPAPETLPVPEDLSRAARRRQASRERRLQRYRQVMQLQEQGVPLRQIARHLRIGRRTVRRWVRAPAFPERTVRRPMPSTLDRFAAHIERRCREGCRQITQIHRELLAQGCRQSYETVRRYVLRLGHKARTPRASAGAQTGPTRKRSVNSNKPVAFPAPSPRRASWWLLTPKDERRVEQRAFVEKLYAIQPALRDTIHLSEEFLRMARQQEPDRLDDWLTRAEQDQAPEMRGLATSLRRDQAAIRAALELPWSTSPVEGQINRLKTIKRQMYGRANFDLLRKRVLHAS